MILRNSLSSDIARAQGLLGEALKTSSCIFYKWRGAARKSEVIRLGRLWEKAQKRVLRRLNTYVDLELAYMAITGGGNVTIRLEK